MKNIVFTGELDYRWAGITAMSGTVGTVAYTAIILASHSTSNSIVVPLAFIFAFGITVSSIGLYHVLGGTAGSRLALFAATANGIAAAQLFAMILVQASVWSVVDQPDAAFKAIWWGLDVAWDLYIGAGTILFGLAMFGRRGLGAWLGVPGVLISVVFLIFNVATFPQPPDTAGLVDLGPLVGLWYLVVYVRLGVAAVFLNRQPQSSTAALSR